MGFGEFMMFLTAYCLIQQLCAYYISIDIPKSNCWKFVIVEMLLQNVSQELPMNGMIAESGFQLHNSTIYTFFSQEINNLVMKISIYVTEFDSMYLMLRCACYVKKMSMICYRI